jgi:hypothetical protein
VRRGAGRASRVPLAVKGCPAHPSHRTGPLPAPAPAPGSAVASIWAAAATVIFCLPTELPVDAENLNYASVLLVGTFLMSNVWFFFPKYGAYKWWAPARPPPPPPLLPPLLLPLPPPRSVFKPSRAIGGAAELRHGAARQRWSFVGRCEPRVGNRPEGERPAPRPRRPPPPPRARRRRRFKGPARTIDDDSVMGLEGGGAPGPYQKELELGGKDPDA